MNRETGPFRRSDRLLDSRDFRRVLRRGRRRADGNLVVVTIPVDAKYNRRKYLEDELPIRSRLGITASRKVGGAVVRNQFKRRIRAWFRQHRSELTSPQDLVVIARRSGALLSLDELDVSLAALLGLERVPIRSN